MKTEKKIFLDKNDDVDKALDELLKTSASRVIVNVPKSSVLGGSIHNFQILKREAETAGKEIIVESIDEHVLQLASLAKMTALNPVFKTKERAVADIVPAFVARKERKPEPEPESVPVIEDVEEIEEKAPRRKEQKERNVKSKPAEPEDEEYRPDFAAGAVHGSPQHPRRFRRKLAWAASFVVIVAAGFFVVTYLLPHVTITLTMKKTSVDFDRNFLVSIAAASSSFSSTSVVLPGQVISAKSNLSMHFDGGTEESVQTKATGTLVVYNAYRSAPQVLVATTRFLSPEGKLFRSLNKITVPGTKASNGTTTPGSTTVTVVADQAGADYNVGPSVGWKIPGFQGTPRYDKFYAEAPSQLSGGFVGTTTVPGKNDLVAAKQEAEQKLQGVLTSQLSLLNSDNLVALPDSSAFEVTNENVTGGRDGSGFDVFVEGDMKQIAFDETMLEDTLLRSASPESGGSFKIDTSTVSYGTSTTDFVNGKMTFEATGTLVYESSVDFNGMKKGLLGQDADSLKAAIFSLPGLQNANVSFWPFWVNRVPTNPANVNLEVK